MYIQRNETYMPVRHSTPHLLYLVDGQRKFNLFRIRQ